MTIVLDSAATTGCSVSGTKMPKAYSRLIATCTLAQDMTLAFGLDFTNDRQIAVLVVWFNFDAFHFENPTEY